MKILFAFVALTLCSIAASGQELSELSMPPNGDNQKAEVSQWIGLVQISIAYHSPRVHFPPDNDRTGHIWGELVHYGFVDEGFGPSKSTPWRAGANESTIITFSHDVKVETKDLKAGRYALFLEVAESGPWTWIFSNDSHGWGSYQYDSRHDALRVPVVPQDATFTEFMTFGFDDRKPDSAVGFLQWEKKRIPFKVDVPNINELYAAQMEQALLSWPGFNYRNWQTAAQFSADNKVNLEKALLWADKAISDPFRGAVTGREDFSTLHTKSAVLEAMGRTADADATMQKALALPATSPAEFYRYGMHLLGEKRVPKAMEVFKLNQQRHPDEKFWTSLGFARGYTATGDKKRAIANWELAIPNTPANLSSNVAQFQAALAALRAG